MTLDVLICTFGPEGLERVAEMTLPSVEGVSYIVSFQNPDRSDWSLPAALERADVYVYEHYSRGLSANRNYAFSRAKADVLLIADDDLSYIPEALRAVMAVFEADESLDFATFRHQGDDHKVYPADGFTFKGHRFPRPYYLTSFELALRRRALESGMRFSTMMGVGTETRLADGPMFGSGEESVFLLDMIDRGLHGRFFPIDIATHRGLTTGMRSPTPAFLRANGAVIRLTWGAGEGLLRVVRDAMRRRVPFLTALRHTLHGYFLAPRIKRGLTEP